MEIRIQVNDAPFRGVIGRLKKQSARQIIDATFPRVARDVRAELVRRVRARWPKIPAKEVRKRITINIPERRFRIYGAGPFAGNLFVRPRWLSLEPKVPAWTGVRRTRLPRTFAASVAKGTKTSVRAKKAGQTDRLGRNIRPAGRRGFVKSKAVIFQRREGGRDFWLVRGPWTMGHLVRVAVGFSWTREQLETRMAAEARRRIEVAAGRTTGRRRT